MASNTTDLYQYTIVNTSECLVLQAQVFIPWNNSDNIISFSAKDMVWKLKGLVFLPITFLIGVPANVINMAVFYRHGLRERINVCLFALSLADGLYLVVNMATEGENVYLHFTSREKYSPVMEWITNHNLIGFYGLSWVSQVLSAIVASERCFCILQPLKSQAILRTSVMTAIIVAVFIVVTGLRFIVTTRYYIACAYDPVSDSIIRTIIGGDFYHRYQKLVDFLDIFLYGLGIPWVVIVVVLATTIVTVIKLRQAAEWRAGMSSSSGSVPARDIALTWMLVGNSIFFIICTFPSGLFRLSLLFLPEMSAGRRQHNMFSVGVWLCNIFSYINSTFNIVVYYTMGSRYRHTIWILLGRKSTKGNSCKNFSDH